MTSRHRFNAYMMHIVGSHSVRSNFVCSITNIQHSKRYTGYFPPITLKMPKKKVYGSRPIQDPFRSIPEPPGSPREGNIQNKIPTQELLHALRRYGRFLGVHTTGSNSTLACALNQNIAISPLYVVVMNMQCINALSVRGLLSLRKLATADLRCDTMVVGIWYCLCQLI
jgi:hypothetical protein